MSQLHVNQLKNYLLGTFSGAIDLSDVPDLKKEGVLLSRSLAAYSIMYYLDVAAEVAAESVVDGRDDNGIDAVHYDESSKSLYLVRSKWSSSGTDPSLIS